LRVAGQPASGVVVASVGACSETANRLPWH
jgi:hypothetical protein